MPAEDNPPSPESPPASPSTWRARTTSIEFAALAGIVCAVTWTVGLRGLLACPGLGATNEEIARYYADPGRTDDVGFLLALITVGSIAYLWFVGVIRSRLGYREIRLVGTVFFGASVLFTALLMVASSALAAPALLVEVGGQAPDPGAVALLRAFNAGILAVFAPRVATLVMFSTATLARRAGVWPRWLVIGTYVVGVVEFVNVTVATPMVYVFPAWIAVVSLVVIVRHPEVRPA